MDNIVGSAKKIKIDKNQRTAMIAVGLAAFVLVFTGFFSSQLYKKMQFQTDVISCLNKSRAILKDNRDSLTKLEDDFKKFNDPDESILGKEKQGDVRNSVIVLRALPVAYSRSELQLNWKKFLSPENGTGLKDALKKHQGYKGTVSFPQGAITAPAAEPAAEGVAVSSSYETIDFTLQVQLQSPEELNQLLEDLENFIMPLKINSLRVLYTQEDNFNAEAEYGTVNLDLQTYFQGKKDIEYRVESVNADTKGDKCKASSSPADDETAAETGNKPEEENE